LRQPWSAVHSFEDSRRLLCPSLARPPRDLRLADLADQEQLSTLMLPLRNFTGRLLRGSVSRLLGRQLRTLGDVYFSLRFTVPWELWLVSHDARALSALLDLFVSLMLVDRDAVPRFLPKPRPAPANDLVN